jgi:ElaB/YqjD/DUF883 family membrane-anchored ribosome-binding protein
MAQGQGDYGRKASDDRGDQISNLAGKAGEQLEQVAQNVESAARSAVEQGRQAGENVQVVADNFKTAVDKSVKDQPLTTLGVAAVLGFVLGALWKA